MSNNKKFAKQIRKIKRDKKRDRGIHGQLKRIKVDTFTKALVGIITIVALIDLQLSYILAFMDKIQIAESLSTQICITILGVAFVYMIRAYFDTRAENNKEVTKEEIEKTVASKIQGTLGNAGINIDLETLLKRPDNGTTIGSIVINESNTDNPYGDTLLCNTEENNNIVG